LLEIGVEVKEKELGGRRAWEKGTKSLLQCRGKYTQSENQKILLPGPSKDVASLGSDPQKCIPDSIFEESKQHS